jgi:hypothetical protein
VTGYNKLFASVVHSTLWAEEDSTVKVFMTMLALADRDGLVEASAPGLAHAARKTVPELEAALAVLSGPDPHSRSPEHEGRRVEKVPGGWRLVNFEKYRDKMNREDQLAKAADRQRRWRERQAAQKEAERQAPKKGGTKAQPFVPPTPQEMFPDHPTPNQLLAQEWMKRLPRYQKRPELIPKELPTWARTLDDCVRIDLCDPDTLTKVVRFIYQDREDGNPRGWLGWSSVIMSPMKLRRKNKDGVKYLEVIRAKVDAGEKPHRPNGGVSTNPEDYGTQDEIPLD